MWGDKVPLMVYTATFERSLFKSKHIVPAVIPRKWQGILHPNYRLKWLNVWDKECINKEAGLLWLI